MSILAAFMVPHPPMIVPAVGRGSEKQVVETTRAYERVAREIAELAPETIIITSPHATLYADYFHISPGKKVKGSFADFRAPQVRFEEEYDEELADRISAIAMEEHFSAGTMGDGPRDDGSTLVYPAAVQRRKNSADRTFRSALDGSL